MELSSHPKKRSKKHREKVKKKIGLLIVRVLWSNTVPTVEAAFGNHRAGVCQVRHRNGLDLQNKLRTDKTSLVKNAHSACTDTSSTCSSFSVQFFVETENTHYIFGWFVWWEGKLCKISGDHVKQAPVLRSGRAGSCIDHYAVPWKGTILGWTW